jgi:hypothetical protein
MMDRIIALFVHTASTHAHEDPLMGAGLGWLRFAVDEPRLYEAVFLRQHPWHAKWGPVRRQMAALMATHPRYAHLDEQACFALVGRASIVMHGLGVELWSRRLPQRDPSALQHLLEQLATPVVDAAMTHSWLDDPHARIAAAADSRSQP